MAGWPRMSAPIDKQGYVRPDARSIVRRALPPFEVPSGWSGLIGKETNFIDKVFERLQLRPDLFWI